MSRIFAFSSTSVLPIANEGAADRLLDDCHLDLSFGVIRRSFPRTYANQVKLDQSTQPVVKQDNARPFFGGIFDNAWSSAEVRMVIFASLTAALFSATLAIVVALLKNGSAEICVTSGVLTFATVLSISAGLSFAALRALQWFGVSSTSLLCEADISKR